MSESFDIAIVGGGMVGATLALALRSGGYRVVLIEAFPFGAQNQPAYDDRSIALSYGSGRILKRFGLWSALSAYAEPIRQIHVSDRGHFGVTRMKAAEEGVPALGYVIESRAFGEVLNTALQKTGSDVRLLCPARVQAIQPSVTDVCLSLEEGSSINARLVVAADGAMSSIRTMLGIAAEEQQYAQTAVIANVTPQLHHQGIAYERFTADGPLAVLPMNDYENRQARCALVWTVPASQAPALLSLSETEFLQALQRRFGYRLGKFIKAGQRSSFALSLVTGAAAVAARTVFVGNAAQTLHPVAGQGFNLALRDVAALVDCLYKQARQSGNPDPGDDDLLKRFQQSRQNDRQRVIQFTDLLVKIFSNDVQPLAYARALGLLGLEIMPGLRRQLVRQAMGAGMPLPHVSF